MQNVKVEYKDKIMKEIDDLPIVKIKEVLEYVYFVKHKRILNKIDPDQLYFYSSQWQKLEKEAENDINAGRVSREYSADEVDEFFRDMKKSS